MTLSCNNNDSSILNLGFEQSDLITGNPVNWILDNDPDYNISLDSKIVHNGKYSLKIENVGNTHKVESRGGSIIIENIQAYRSIKLTGFIKTENTSSDSLGLYIGVDNFGDRVGNCTKSKDLSGTHDWKEYTVELSLKAESESIKIGVVLNGVGKIWVDDLKLFIDEKQILNIPQMVYAANQRELNWLQTHSTKIKTVQAENGFDDLQPLKQMIGNARIVGLGENTHGSSEVFKMKHRLIVFLATEMDFTIFSIEADMPEAYKLNDYVIYGKGDPKVLLKGMNKWQWDTQEILDLIEWMRKFNSGGKGRIQFTGFDMQPISGALETISNFAEKHDRILKPKIDSVYLLLNNSSNISIKSFDIAVKINNISTGIYSYLIENKNSISLKISESEYKWLIQNAVVMIQSSDTKNLTDFSFRDNCMAKNID